MPLQDAHRGIVLFYPVRERKTDKATIGFELLFPNNDISFDMNFTVRRKSESASVVIQDSGSD